MCRDQENTELELPGGWCGRHLEGEAPSQVSYYLPSLGCDVNTQTALVFSQKPTRELLKHQFHWAGPCRDPTDSSLELGFGSCVL